MESRERLAGCAGCGCEVALSVQFLTLGSKVEQARDIGRETGDDVHVLACTWASLQGVADWQNGMIAGFGPLLFACSLISGVEGCEG